MSTHTHSMQPRCHTRRVIVEPSHLRPSTVPSNNSKLIPIGWRWTFVFIIIASCIPRVLADGDTEDHPYSSLSSHFATTLLALGRVCSIISICSAALVLLTYIRLKTVRSEFSNRYIFYMALNDGCGAIILLLSSVDSMTEVREHDGDPQWIALVRSILLQHMVLSSVVWSSMMAMNHLLVVRFSKSVDFIRGLEKFAHAFVWIASLASNIAVWRTGAYGDGLFWAWCGFGATNTSSSVSLWTVYLPVCACVMFNGIAYAIIIRHGRKIAESITSAAGGAASIAQLRASVHAARGHSPMPPAGNKVASSSQIGHGRKLIVITSEPSLNDSPRNLTVLPSPSLVPVSRMPQPEGLVDVHTPPLRTDSLQNRAHLAALLQADQHHLSKLAGATASGDATNNPLSPSPRFHPTRPLSRVVSLRQAQAQALRQHLVQQEHSLSVPARAAQLLALALEEDQDPSTPITLGVLGGGGMIVSTAAIHAPMPQSSPGLDTPELDPDRDVDRELDPDQSTMLDEATRVPETLPPTPRRSPSISGRPRIEVEETQIDDTVRVDDDAIPETEARTPAAAAHPTAGPAISSPSAAACSIATTVMNTPPTAASTPFILGGGGSSVPSTGLSMQPRHIQAQIDTPSPLLIPTRTDGLTFSKDDTLVTVTAITQQQDTPILAAHPDSHTPLTHTPPTAALVGRMGGATHSHAISQTHTHSPKLTLYGGRSHRPSESMGMLGQGQGFLNSPPMGSVGLAMSPVLPSQILVQARSPSPHATTTLPYPSPIPPNRSPVPRPQHNPLLLISKKQRYIEKRLLGFWIALVLGWLPGLINTTVTVQREQPTRVLLVIHLFGLTLAGLFNALAYGINTRALWQLVPSCLEVQAERVLGPKPLTVAVRTSVVLSKNISAVGAGQARQNNHARRISMSGRPTTYAGGFASHAAVGLGGAGRGGARMQDSSVVHSQFPGRTHRGHQASVADESALFASSVMPHGTATHHGHAHNPSFSILPSSLGGHHGGSFAIAHHHAHGSSHFSSTGGPTFLTPRQAAALAGMVSQDSAAVAAALASTPRAGRLPELNSGRAVSVHDQGGSPLAGTAGSGGSGGGGTKISSSSPSPVASRTPSGRHSAGLPGSTVGGTAGRFLRPASGGGNGSGSSGNTPSRSPVDSRRNSDVVIHDPLQALLLATNHTATTTATLTSHPSISPTSAVNQSQVSVQAASLPSPMSSPLALARFLARTGRPPIAPAQGQGNSVTGSHGSSGGSSPIYAGSQPSSPLASPSGPTVRRVLRPSGSTADSSPAFGSFGLGMEPRPQRNSLSLSKPMSQQPSNWSPFLGSSPGLSKQNSFVGASAGLVMTSMAPLDLGMYNSPHGSRASSDHSANSRTTLPSGYTLQPSDPLATRRRSGVGGGAANMMAGYMMRGGMPLPPIASPEPQDPASPSPAHPLSHGSSSPDSSPSNERLEFDLLRALQRHTSVPSASVTCTQSNIHTEEHINT